MRASDGSEIENSKVIIVLGIIFLAIVGAVTIVKTFLEWM